MEYVFIRQPAKQKEAHEEPRCPLANDHEWSKYMYAKGYFLTPRHAIEFLESHRPLQDIKPVKIYTDVSIKKDDS